MPRAPSRSPAKPTTASLACAASNKRLYAFAVCPTPDPKAAADELERAVPNHGFKGTMIHGLTNGVFHDDKRFWPIYERAEALDVLRSTSTPPIRKAAVVETYYKDYLPAYPNLATAGWRLRRRDQNRKASASCSRACSRNIRSCRSSSATWARRPALLPLAHQPGAVAPRPMPGQGAKKSFRDIFSASISTSRPAASSPMRRCNAASPKARHRPRHVLDRLSFRPQPAGHESWINPLQMNKAADKEKILSGNAKRLFEDRGGPDDPESSRHRARRALLAY